MKSDSLIVGKWEATDFFTSVPVDENKDEIKNTNLKEEVECIAMEINFRSNGALSIESTNMTYDISFENGEVILKPKGCEGEIQNGKWSINENSTLLFIEFNSSTNENPDVSNIDIELTNKQLILKDMVYEEGENPITYSIKFKRK